MMVYIVRSMSQKLCTPPQTSAKLLTLDTTDNITIGINPNGTTILAIDITAAEDHSIAVIAFTKATDTIALKIVTTTIDTTIADFHTRNIINNTEA